MKGLTSQLAEFCLFWFCVFMFVNAIWDEEGEQKGLAAKTIAV